MISLHLDDPGWMEEPRLRDIQRRLKFGWQGWPLQWGKFVVYYDGWHWYFFIGCFYFGKSEHDKD